MKKIYALIFLIISFLPTFGQRKPKTAAPPAPTWDVAAFEAVKWRNIGPFRGGRSVAASGVPGQPQTYYMGSTGGGIWKTEDAGLSWKNISDGFLSLGSVGAIAVAVSDPNVVYVGMGEHAVRGVMTSHGNGLYKSTDAGKTWQKLPGLEQSRHISDVRIHPQNPDVVWVAVQGAVHGPSAERGIYKTTDGGQTWRKVLYVDENTGASSLSLDATNPRILYAAMWQHRRYPWKVESGGPGSAIYKSTNGGETWEKLSEGLPKLMGKIGLSVSPANPNRVFANIEAEEGGVYRSDDGGKKWARVSADRVTQARSWYYMEIFADPKNENTVYVLNAPMLKSIDGGRTFAPLRIPHGDTHDLWINPDQPNNMILADDGGASVTFNGGQTWSTQENQPTAQFYRVNADNLFPYHLYGGQQDNTSVKTASRTNGMGVGWKDWEACAGCESAFLAFDPDNPRYVYGGCYQGYIEVMDTETGEVKDLMAYPEPRLAEAPKNMRYRFNWNAPILVSKFDKKTIYHAGNKVLKSVDNGLTWSEISPDLTRNDTTKQGFGGGPITNEGAGGENYNTIAYLIESPHAKGTLWAGSDCGLVHVTTDEGKTWKNATPAGLEESLINSIEVSPHDPNTVYLAVTRYKFNDFRPMLYKTTDGGKTWANLVNGIAPEDFVRVVREDKVRKGLLYLGTETGMYLSMDGGANWSRMKGNFPVVPVTDLLIHQNDLIAATSGRAFWILDDLGSFQQSGGAFAGTTLQLFAPKPTVKFQGYGGPEPVPGYGQNPPNGVIIDYYLAADADTALLKLEILDESGKVIRTFDNKKEEKPMGWAGGPAPKTVLPAKKGVNRFAWDFRREGVPPIPQVFVNGDYRGGTVAPGTYRIRLTKGTDSQEVTCVVLPDPRLSATPADFAAQQQLLLAIEQAVANMHESVNAVRQAKAHVDAIQTMLKGKTEYQVLLDSAKSLAAKMEMWEKALIQPKQKTFQDVINFQNTLNADFLDLKSRVDTHDPRPTAGVAQRLADLQARWQQHRNHLQTLLDGDLAAFNRLYQTMQLPAVILPRK